MAKDDVRPGSSGWRPEASPDRSGRKRRPPTIEGATAEIIPGAASGETSPTTTDADPAATVDMATRDEFTAGPDAEPEPAAGAAAAVEPTARAESAADIEPPAAEAGRPSIDAPGDAMSIEPPSMAAAAADLAAPERPAEAFASTGAPYRPSTADVGTGMSSAATVEHGPPSWLTFALAVIGLIVAVLLGINLYMMLHPAAGGPLADMQGDLGALDKRVATLEARPVTTVDLGPVEQQLKALEGKVQQMAAAAPAGADPALLRRLSAIEDKAGGTDKALADLQGRVAAIPGPIDGKLAGLAAALAALKAELAALPRVDLGPVEARLDALDKRLAPIEAEFSQPKIATSVTEARQNGSGAQSRAAPEAVTVTAVQQALADGKPFPTAVTALQSLGVDEAALSPLRAVAATGAPTKADLVAGFDEARTAILTASAPVKTGTVFDRMLASAQGLVKVRSAGTSPGADTDAVTSRIAADLQAGAFGAAATEWDGLPEAGKRASTAWAARLKARAAADEAAQALLGSAIAALGSKP